jgi:VanZ family protein
MMQWLRRWGPSVLMMMLIYLASGTPGNDLPDLGSWDRIVLKGGHVLGYAMLGAAYLHGLAFGKESSWRTWLIAFVLAGCYAATDEFHQSFTPGRTPSFSDVGLDTVSAILGAGLWGWARRNLKAQIPQDWGSRS